MIKWLRDIIFGEPVEKWEDDTKTFLTEEWRAHNPDKTCSITSYGVKRIYTRKEFIQSRERAVELIDSVTKLMKRL